MKKIIISQLFVLATAFNLSLYSQEAPNIAENLEQRKQEVNTLVQQEFEKGTLIPEIYKLLSNLISKTPEDKMRAQIYDQRETTRSKLKESKEQCCQDIRHELNELYKAKRLRESSGIYFLDESEIDNAQDKLERCKKNCSTPECKNLQQEIDKFDQEYDKARDAVSNTPEGTLRNQIGDIYAQQREIKSIKKELYEKQKRLRPLKIKKEKLEEETEAMLNSLKSELSQQKKPTI